jgi:N-acetyl-1-D-myo-inositol-2-amino-2-deoxy-alpha-D-glucopyranoside deacetylase
MRRLLLVHAHPDDETLTTGGTIARYAHEPDTSVTVVTCTLGEQGEVIPPQLALLGPDEADQLGGYRIGELAAACAALGVTDHRYLGGPGRWRDSGMALAGHGVRAALPEVLHPRAFAAPEAFDAEVDALVAVLEEVAPQVVVTYGPDGGYGHPDHVRAHDITVAALERVPARLYCTAVARPTLDAGLAGLAGRARPAVPDPRAGRAARRAGRRRHGAAGRVRRPHRAARRPAGARHADLGVDAGRRGRLRDEQPRRPAVPRRRGVHPRAGG